MSKVHRPQKPLTLGAALKDGKVTGAEAKRIAQTYEHNRGIRKHRGQLVKTLDANLDKFDPAAQKSLGHLLGAKLAALPEPGAVKGPGVAAINGYARAYGSVFVNGVSENDLKQGQLGDCYFLSSINSLVHQNPAAIKNLFHSNPNGTVTITFYGRTTQDGPRQPIAITVDRRLPVDKSGADPYVSTRNQRELWPKLLEKAYALFRSQYPYNGDDHGSTGYNAIGQGGYMGDALSALSGRETSYTANAGASADAIWSQLCSAAASKTPMVAASNSTVEAGLVDSHAYSIYGVEEQTGQRYVVLHNPWGYQEVGHDGNNDGTFKLPLDQFLSNFGGFTTLS